LRRKKRGLERGNELSEDRRTRGEHTSPIFVKEILPRRRGGETSRPLLGGGREEKGKKGPERGRTFGIGTKALAGTDHSNAEMTREDRGEKPESAGHVKIQVCGEKGKSDLVEEEII